jgi:Domain of unknown function (DUF4375)
MILPSTAESTGGLCMPCKQGIRAQMEQSRKYHESLKQYNPYRELWLSLVKRSTDDRTLSKWSDDERTYFCVRLLEGEVYNGGFDQFFTNSSGEYYKVALNGLDQLNATNSHRLLEQAAWVAFKGMPPPKDRRERQSLIFKFEDDKQQAALDRLDKLFWDDPDHLGELLSEFAKVKGLIEPFLTPPT